VTGADEWRTFGTSCALTARLTYGPPAPRSVGWASVPELPLGGGHTQARPRATRRGPCAPGASASVAHARVGSPGAGPIFCRTEQ
jgi:hypothetical protein